MRVWLLCGVVVFAALGCSERATAERSGAPSGSGTRTVEAAFFRMEIPARWREQDRRTEAQRSAVVAAFEAPAPDPVVRVIVGRPVRFAGSAEEFGDTQLNSLEILGVGLRSRRDVRVGRWAAHRMEGERGDGAYWTYVLADGGFAWTIFCGGPGARAVDRGRCEAMVGSFALTERLDAHAPPESSPVVAGRTLSLAGTRFTTPDGWEPAPQLLRAIPRAVWLVRSSRLVGRAFASASLSVDPFEGSLEEYDRLSNAASAEAGITAVRRAETTLLGQPAIEVVEDYPPELGGHRSLSIQTVHAGRGWLLTCSGAPEEDARIREGCEIIRASLRLM